MSIVFSSRALPSGYGEQPIAPHIACEISKFKPSGPVSETQRKERIESCQWPSGLHRFTVAYAQPFHPKQIKDCNLGLAGVGVERESCWDGGENAGGKGTHCHPSTLEGEIGACLG